MQTTVVNTIWKPLTGTFKPDVQMQISTQNTHL